MAPLAKTSIAPHASGGTRERDNNNQRPSANAEVCTYLPDRSFDLRIPDKVTKRTC